MSRLFGLEFSYLPLILFLTSAILAAVSLQQMPDKGFSAQRATRCFCIENSKSGAPHKALVCPEKKKNALTRHTGSLCTRNNVPQVQGTPTSNKNILISTHPLEQFGLSIQTKHHCHSATSETQSGQKFHTTVQKALLFSHSSCQTYT